MESKAPLVPINEISRRIFLVRGRRVMLDSDLAAMYGETTARLNQQVRRNIRRFPEEFMFELSREEYAGLMLQSAISKKGSGGRRKLPLVFTQEGVAMLSGVLQSPRAIEVNIAIMKAFIRLKEMVSLNAEMEAKFSELERRIGRHDKYIRELFAAIRKLMAPIDPPKPPIGFRTED
ncbi:MAG: hypothetical protein A2X36_10340 [Elusimicrobia bacterium GWA2_69_24]|nr:MAG: hypothetical protein A2X36_10340 [Elusimicrobia bacterium GWA2_69_24]HBL18282.1 DNA-binding protein [Elusimicrobiota bacterium]